jgi:ribonuclease G
MLPDGFGVIVRTVAQGQDKEAIEDDMRTVLKKWERILNKLESAKPPTLLYKDLDITESLIRDLFAKQYDRVLIDDYQLYKSVKSYVSQIAPKMLPSVQVYKGKDHIFDHVNIGQDVNSIFSPRVRMPSGGYLIFEQTEAMYVVDVNSGPYAAKERQEDNSLKTNLEAAREIAKQLRLRDIGGIIVVDFIDLRDDKNRKKIYDELKKEFKKDRAKTNVIGMSDFGLVQITRQRIRPSVVNSVSKVCPMCGGSGSVVSQDTIITDIESWISKFKYSTEYRAVDIYINPYLQSFLTRGFFSQRRKWMWKYKVKITFVADENTSLNEFKATLTGSDLEITDVVLQGGSLDKVLAAQEKQLQQLDEKVDPGDTLDYYSKNDENGSDRKNLPKRPKRPARQGN